MNKILPIILVVVLSGCSLFSSESEYLCSIAGKNNYDIYLKITNDEIIMEGRSKNGRPYTDIYKINTETSKNIIAVSTISDNEIKLSIDFDKRLLRIYYTSESKHFKDIRFSHECKEL